MALQATIRVRQAGVRAGTGARLLALFAIALHASAFADDAAFQAVADDYIDHYYLPAHPSGATQLGVHTYDDRIEDYSRAGLHRQAATLHRYLARLEALPAAGLSQHAGDDREMLINSIRADLLSLEEWRPWEKNPDTYSSSVTNSAYVIMQREYAPADERLRHLVAREHAMPAALAAARVNLKNPPRIWTEIAIEQMPGAIGFFRKDLPQAFEGVQDAALQAQFAASNAAVIKALEAYQQWLKGSLLARSKGDFRLGADLFRRELALDEMVDTPLDQLLATGMADLRRNQAEFARVAGRMEPGKPTAEVLAELGRDVPTPDRLLQAFRETFDGITRFIDARNVITIPAGEPPILRETPPFMRATTFASMDTPGPFEPRAHEAYFSVTLPEAGWDAKRVAGFMSQFSYPVISNVTVHEAYPGHFVQGLWIRSNPDRIRQLLGASTYVEGWAHYCEQMMLDEGFGQPAPGSGAAGTRAADLLRLGQLQDALLRDARYIVAIRLHTQGMSLEDAVKFFVDEGYQSHEVGEAETKRGTADALYLYYTLGKLQIMKLRADVQAREGAAFTLKSFHDRLMQLGQPPLRIARREMLGSDSPTL
ncbi:MAG: hypothetical protein RL684_1995 [Pseudomonadota bacterium]